MGEAIGLIQGGRLTAEEKQQLLTTIYDAQKVEEQELTKRAQADAMSDSWLSKNVRPLVLIWCIVIFSTFGVLDAIDNVEFTINTEWNLTFRQVMTAVVGFYFGGRTIEKGIYAYRELKR